MNNLSEQLEKKKLQKELSEKKNEIEQLKLMMQVQKKQIQYLRSKYTLVNQKAKSQKIINDLTKALLKP